MDIDRVLPIQDLDGSVKNVRDFITPPTGFTPQGEVIITPEMANASSQQVRPDLVALYTHQDPNSYPYLIFTLNKCLLDLEVGEKISYG